MCRLHLPLASGRSMGTGAGSERSKRGHRGGTAWPGKDARARLRRRHPAKPAPSAQARAHPLADGARRAPRARPRAGGAADRSARECIGVSRHGVAASAGLRRRHSARSVRTVCEQGKARSSVPCHHFSTLFFAACAGKLAPLAPPPLAWLGLSARGLGTTPGARVGGRPIALTLRSAARGVHPLAFVCGRLIAARAPRVFCPPRAGGFLRAWAPAALESGVCT